MPATPDINQLIDIYGGSKPEKGHSVGIFISVLLFLLPTIFNSFLTKSNFICPTEHYVRYCVLLIVSPPICVLLITLALSTNLWSNTRHRLTWKEMIWGILKRNLLAMIVIALTIAVNLQFTNYYACLIVGPEPIQEDPTYKIRFNNEISNSITIGWYIMLGLFGSITVIYIFSTLIFTPTSKRLIIDDIVNNLRTALKMKENEVIKQIATKITDHQYRNTMKKLEAINPDNIETIYSIIQDLVKVRNENSEELLNLRMKHYFEADAIESFSE